MSPEDREIIERLMKSATDAAEQLRLNGHIELADKIAFRAGQLVGLVFKLAEKIK